MWCSLYLRARSLLMVLIGRSARANFCFSVQSGSLFCQGSPGLRGSRQLFGATIHVARSHCMVLVSASARANRMVLAPLCGSLPDYGSRLVSGSLRKLGARIMFGSPLL